VVILITAQCADSSASLPPPPPLRAEIDECGIDGRAALQRPRVRLVLAYNQAGVGGSASSGRRFWQQDSDSSDLEAVIQYMSALAGDGVKVVIVG